MKNILFLMIYLSKNIRFYSDIIDSFEHLFFNL